MRNGFRIPYALPSLNDVIAANRKNRYKGANLKSSTEFGIKVQIRVAINAGLCRPIEKPCRIVFTWGEKDRRRDLDNVFSAKKFVLDAMVASGILPDDGQKWVTGLDDDIRIGVDYVDVRIIEDGDPDA